MRSEAKTEETHKLREQAYECWGRVDKRKRLGDCDDIHVAILKMNKQQGPDV